MNKNNYSVIDYKDIGVRISEIRGKLSQSEFGAPFGVDQQNLSKYETGSVKAPLELLLQISIKHKKSLEWIISGKITPTETSDCFSLVPKYKARLSGGSGSFETSAEIENFLSFKTTWLRARCPMNNCGLFEVRGDSMSPFITDGDVVLVDMKKNQTEDIIDGKIYAFSEGDRIRIKRLTLKGSSIVAYSDNKLEGGEPAPVESDFILIGKVVWVGHEVG